MLKDMYFHNLQKKYIGLKTASKKVVCKTGEFLGNKIADTVIKSNEDKIVKEEPVEQIIIPTEDRDEILNKLRQVLL